MTNNKNKSDNWKGYLLPASILIAAVLISGALVYSSLQSSSGSATAGNTADQPQQPQRPQDSQGASANIERVDVEGEPFIGEEDAPATMAYWFDFQCPFCKRFETQTLPTLISEYVDEGKLRIVFKDYQFLGPDSQTAGLVAQAVWEIYPDKYLKWHKAIFEAQDGENSGFGNKESILELIRNKLPAIDADKVADKIEQNRQDYQAEQDEDKSSGQGFGVQGTPGVIIGNRLISGAQPTSVFTQVIDRQLSGDGSQANEETKADKTIKVSGTEYSFSPSTIKVEKGQSVKVSFRNEGSISHNLVIPDLGVGSEVIGAGRTSSFTFTAPKSGTFPIRFECTIPGHAESGMTGEVTLQ